MYLSNDANVTRYILNDTYFIIYKTMQMLLHSYSDDNIKFYFITTISCTSYNSKNL